MANIEHKNIPDPNIHEPKGISSATAGEIYVADGAGSGDWIVPEPRNIELASAGDVYVADGNGSGKWRSNHYFIELYLDQLSTLTRNITTINTDLDFELDYISDLANNFAYDNITHEITYTGDIPIVIKFEYNIAIQRTDTGGSPELTFFVSRDGGTGYEKLTKSITASQFTGTDVTHLGNSFLCEIQTGCKLKMGVRADAALNTAVRNIVIHINTTLSRGA